jgi:regulatory protein
MAPPSSHSRRPPLDSRRLEELALRYVERFATTRTKLRAYLLRKVRERGWSEAREPDIDGLASRFCELGYVNDAAYALAKSQALSSRGYGRRRLQDKLRLAGIAEEDSTEALEHAERQAVDAALRFARRRRIGPFATILPDSNQRERAIAAMVRAGHSFPLSRAIARLAPGSTVDEEALRQEARLTLS